MVFDTFWFKKNQRALLKAVNHPLLGGFVRRGMWIQDRERVLKITPESVHVLLPDGQIKATMYCNNQYAEALHKNFKPLWDAIHAWDMQIANSLAPALNLGFDTLISQPATTAGNNVEMEDDTPNTNKDGSNLIVGELQGFAIKTRTMIKFDLSSIASTATITSSTMSWWVSADYSANARNFDVYRCLRAWTRTGVTWNKYDGTNNWTTAGCGGAGSDYDSGTVWASTAFGNAEAVDTQKDFSLTASEVKKFVDGTYTNNGWVVMAQTELYDAYEFYSSYEATKTTQRPKLVTVYTLPNSANFFFENM